MKFNSFDNWLTIILNSFDINEKRWEMLRNHYKLSKSLVLKKIDCDIKTDIFQIIKSTQKGFK
jgi:hypothetical protein